MRPVFLIVPCFVSFFSCAVILRARLDCGESSSYALHCLLAACRWRRGMHASMLMQDWDEGKTNDERRVRRNISTDAADTTKSRLVLFVYTFLFAVWDLPILCVELRTRGLQTARYERHVLLVGLAATRSHHAKKPEKRKEQELESQGHMAAAAHTAA